MKELLIVRHGQTEWNAKKRVMGRKPIPLNHRGIAQAHGISDYLKGANIDAIYTSPVARAKQTAEIIAINHPKTPFEENIGLAEVDFGKWIDLTFDDLFEQYSDEFHKYFKKPEEAHIDGGEQLHEALARVGSFIDKIKSKHENQRVLIVSHADPVKMAIIHSLGLPLSRLQAFSIDNCALVIIRFDPRFENGRIIMHNTKNGFGGDM